ncbi:MAG: hypothetical protein JWM98_582 [Thermoleophilia bacterium]|nr:hypothetical protein [Thermoleophilia bacterium]
MPGELLMGAMARGMVRATETKLDRVPEIGTALSDAARASAAHAGTTLLVSGYAGSARGLGPMLRSLARDGIAARAVEIPGGGLASVREGVAELDRAIAAAPEGPIHLAGHSKGATVIQSWYANATAAQRARVESMTLLSSTPTGQRLSPLMQLQANVMAPITGPFSRIVAETQYTNPVMAEIRDADIASHVRGLSVVSEKDGLIKLPEAQWEGAATHVIRGDDAPDHMHTLVSGEAYDAMVGNILRRSPGVTP